MVPHTAIRMNNASCEVKSTKVDDAPKIERHTTVLCVKDNPVAGPHVLVRVFKGENAWSILEKYITCHGGHVLRARVSHFMANPAIHLDIEAAAFWAETA